MPSTCERSCVWETPNHHQKGACVSEGVVLSFYRVFSVLVSAVSFKLVQQLAMELILQLPLRSQRAMRVQMAKVFVGCFWREFYADSIIRFVVVVEALFGVVIMHVMKPHSQFIRSRSGTFLSPPY